MSDQADGTVKIDVKQVIRDELDKSREKLSEAELLLRQSQAELSKLTQRNASSTGHLQQIQANLEGTSKQDIRTAYNAVLDAQQRLLVMRAQLEKLQGEQNNTKRFIQFLEDILEILDEQLVSSGGNGRSSAAAILEMVIDAQEIERQRLSRHMHDGPVQALSNFIIQADIVSKYFNFDPDKAKEELANLRATADGTFRKVRDFIFELRPMMLDDLGLIPTLKRYADTYKGQTGVDVSLLVQGQDQRLDSYLEVMIFRAIQELLRNAHQHNQDNLMNLVVEVLITIDENQVQISVKDTGKGFPSDNLNEDSGLGIKLIRERVEMLGGIFEIDSSVGKGCTVSIQVPSIDASPEQQFFTAG